LGAINDSSTHLLKNNRVLDLLTTHGSLKVAENQIIHTGSGISHLGLKFNVPDGCTKQTIKKTLIPFLNTVLPDVIWCDDILLKQWVKLAINCVINPLTALFDIKNGNISDAKFTGSIEQVLDEVIAVANRENVNLNKEELTQTVLLVAKNTKNNSSSMRCDIHNGRETEIEYINGYIHRLGKEFNIPTPKNTELYQNILAL
jgi:2-dehydropantoate 2-reductase